MSDYDPNLGRTPGGPNRYGHYDYRDPNDEGRPGLVLLAILAGVALVGGFLYFANPQNNLGPEQAQAPITQPAQPAQPAPIQPTQPTE